MATRTQRLFNDNDKKDFLNELKAFREVCLKVCIKAPIGSDAYKLGNKFIEEISSAGETLTGNNRYFLPH